MNPSNPILPPEPPANLQLLARQIVEGFLIGLHKSPFHGFSVEFAEHRLYSRGDNLKHVDWKVYGRSDKMFVKKFEEETNLRCCLAIDTSSSMRFPQTGWSKLDYAALMATALTLLLKKQMDAVSLALFDDKLHALSASKTGLQHQQTILSRLDALRLEKAPGVRTRLPEALHELAERLHKRSLVVVFSDLPVIQESATALLHALEHLKFNKHEVLLFHLADDQTEIRFDFENRPYTFEDPETGETLKLNPDQIKAQYLDEYMHYRKFLETALTNLRIDSVFCDVTTPPHTLLQHYLVKRARHG